MAGGESSVTGETSMLRSSVFLLKLNRCLRKKQVARIRVNYVWGLLLHDLDANSSGDLVDTRWMGVQVRDGPNRGCRNGEAVTNDRPYEQLGNPG